MFRKAAPTRPDWGQITTAMRQHLLACGDDGQTTREVSLCLRKARVFAAHPRHVRERLSALGLGEIRAEGSDLVLRTYLNPFEDALDDTTRTVEDLSAQCGWVLEERVVCVVEGR
ncbi:MAG: hypothetical protein AAFY65_00870 [Pseudomonadota bacterium]